MTNNITGPTQNRIRVLDALRGFAHLMLLWSGDILMLYAAMGMILPLFWRCSERVILRWAGGVSF